MTFTRFCHPFKSRSGAGSTVLIVILSVLGAIVMLGLLAAMAIPAFNRVREQARHEAAKQKASQPVKTLTARDKMRVKEFGETLAKAIQQKKSSLVNGMHDFEALADRILMGTNFPRSFRKGLIEGMSQHQGGMFRELMGQDCRLTRISQRDGLISLTLRITFEGGGVNFVEALVHPSDGTYKVVDIYTYLFGTLGSAESRSAMLLMTKQDTGSISKLLNMNDIDPKKWERLTGFMSSFQKRKFADVVKEYDSLPNEMKDSPTLFRIYLQALQMVENPTQKQRDAYAKALEDAPKVIGKDNSLALLRIDPLFEKGDFKGAIACIREVLAAVGEDSYLTRMIVAMALCDKDLATAETNLALAEKLEPEHVDLVDLRLQVLCLKKDFAGVVSELERFSADKRGTITPKILREEKVYEEFLSSPEGKAWAASLEK